MKRRFVFNPSAGRAVSSRKLQKLKDFFAQVTGSFDYIIPQGRAGTISETRKALHEGIDQIVAVGGDGTLNAVVNGFFENGALIRPEACLAIAPVGTGSDYFRSIKGELKKSAWPDIVLKPQVKAVDVGVLRMDCGGAAGKSEPRYFINATSFGMSAEIVQEKERSFPLWLPRSMAYLVPTLKKGLCPKSVRATLRIDGNSTDVEIMAMFVSKGRYAGGGMRFAAGASLDDGFFEVTVFGKLSVMDVLMNLGSLYSGDFSKVPGVSKYKASRVDIECVKPVAVEYDGEPEGVTPADVCLLPKALNVCFPSNSL
ncbi:MAG: diacylglycerol kinase family protein [Bdellovibrionota bacterium]